MITRLMFWIAERVMGRYWPSVKYLDEYGYQAEQETRYIQRGPFRLYMTNCNVLDCDSVSLTLMKPTQWDDLYLSLISYDWVRGTEKVYSSGLHIRGCRFWRWVQVHILLPIGLWEKDW